MGLGSIFRGVGGEVSLTRLLKTYTQLRTDPPLTVTDFVRSSSFYKVCAREEVLRATHKIDRDDFVSADLNLIFSHGTALHWSLQNHVLPSLGILLGQWKCLTCAHLHGAASEGRKPTNAAIRRPTVCNVQLPNFPSLRCAGEEFLFVEYDLIDEEHRITGHCDGFLALPGMSGLGVLEAKSIGSASMWKVKNNPKLEHVLQGQIYLWLTGLEWMIVLYWEKGANGIKALKEHFVERDEETIKKVKTELRALWDGLAGGPTPFRICASPECERALSCSAKTQCFEGYAPEADDGVGKF